MSQTKIVYHLELKPVQIKSFNVNEESDQWLINDDHSLLNFNYAEQQKKEECLPSLNHVTIIPTTAGFDLQEGNNRRPLKHGERVKLGSQWVEVGVIEEQIVPLEVEQEETSDQVATEMIEDIWGGTSISNQPAQHRFADPFAQSHDQLDFLYQPASSQKMPPSLSTQPTKEGNVLEALGIHAEGSRLINRSYPENERSYLDQSPMDLLDAYLDEEESIRYDTQHSPTFIPPSSIGSQNSSYSSAKVSTTCKKLLKIFTD